MAKDPTIASHVAASKAKIEQLARDIRASQHRLWRTSQAVESSKKLLRRSRDPLWLGTGE